MFNNPYYNNNLTSVITGYRVTPVARIEETENCYPDLQGNPLLFFDQTKNEFYVKQRKVQTGEIEVLRYVLTKEPIKKPDTQVDLMSKKLESLEEQLKRIDEALSVKAKKEVKNDE